MTEITARPLDAAAFAPFGTVAEAGEAQGATDVSGSFVAAAEAATPVLHLVRIVSVERPFRLRRLERHPHSSQSFVPVEGVAALIVVCGSRPDGTPDLGTLEAFTATGRQVVTYHRGVWHQSLTPFATPAAFAMTMATTGRGDDTDLHPLAEPVSVRVPGLD